MSEGHDSGHTQTHTETSEAKFKTLTPGVGLRLFLFLLLFFKSFPLLNLTLKKDVLVPRSLNSGVSRDIKIPQPGLQQVAVGNKRSWGCQ